MRFVTNLMKFLNFLDIFRFEMRLTFNKQEKTSTFTGKIMTIGIVIFLFFSFLESDMVKKTKPQTLNQDLIPEKRPSMVLSKENFTLSFVITTENNSFLADETIFSFFLTISRVNSSTHEQNLQSFRLNSCTPGDFKSDPTIFEKLGLNGTYCLPNENLKLNGYFNEEMVENFWIELKACKNSTENNFSCKSSEDINKALLGNYINIFMTNHDIDASNYNEPIRQTIKVFYYFLDPGLIKSVILYIKNTIVATDDGFFFDSWNYFESFIIGNVEVDLLTRILENNEIFFGIEIYSSNYQTVVKRNYQTIKALVAEIGGVLNILLILGFLLSKLEKDYMRFSLISNELFIFQKIERVRNSVKNPNATANHTIKSNNTKEIFLGEVKTVGNKQNEINIMLTNNQKIIRKNKTETNNANTLTYPPVLVTLFNENRSLENKNEENKENEIHAKCEFVKLKNKQLDDEKMMISEILEREENNNLSPKSEKSPTHKKNFFRRFLTRKEPSKNFDEKIMDNLEHYQKLKQKENYFSLGFVGFLKFLVKKSIPLLENKMSREEKLFDQAKEQIDDLFDILGIFRKLQDIEKLKRILFNDEQLYFFDLLSRPMIAVQEKRENQLAYASFSNKMKVEKEKLLEMYKNVQNKAIVSEIDKRILTLLDKDAKFFLQNEKLDA